MCVVVGEARVYCGGRGTCVLWRGFDVFINLSLDVAHQGWWYRVLPLAFPRFLLHPFALVPSLLMRAVIAVVSAVREKTWCKS